MNKSTQNDYGLNIGDNEDHDIDTMNDMNDDIPVIDESHDDNMKSTEIGVDNSDDMDDTVSMVMT